MPYVLITQCVRAVTPLWKSCELMIKSTHKVDASRVARAYAKPEDVAQDSVIISEFAITKPQAQHEVAQLRLVDFRVPIAFATAGLCVACHGCARPEHFGYVAGNQGGP